MHPLRLSLFVLLLLTVLGLSQEAEADDYTGDVVMTESTGPSFSGTLEEDEYVDFGYILENIDWDFTQEMRISHFDIVVSWEANGKPQYVTFNVSSENDTAGESQEDDGDGGTMTIIWAVNALPEGVNGSADSPDAFVSSFETNGEWMGGRFRNEKSNELDPAPSIKSVNFTISLTYYTWDIENIREGIKAKPDLYISELSFSNNNPEEGDVVTFEATVKLLGMNVSGEFEVGFFLDSEDGEQIGSVTVDGSNMSFGIQYKFKVSTTWKATSGSHTIYVVADSTNVIDESEEKNDLSKVITVGFEEDSNEPIPGAPTAIAGQDVSISPGGTVQFSGAGTDEDGSITKYEWDFDGDGVFEWSSNENGLTIFIFNNAGTYTSTLRVTDNDGKTATDSLTVTVKSSEEEESRLPSLSLLAVVTMLGIVSILRRR